MWAGPWRQFMALGRQQCGGGQLLPASGVVSTSALKWDPNGAVLPPLHSLRDHESTCPWDWPMTTWPQLMTHINTKLNWSIFGCCCCSYFQLIFDFLKDWTSIPKTELSLSFYLDPWCCVEWARGQSHIWGRIHFHIHKGPHTATSSLIWPGLEEFLK